VTLDLWRVRPSRVGAAAARMALDRRHLRRTRGLAFSRLLGTGAGRTFTLRDADPLCWGVLAVWAAADPATARADVAAFERSPTVAGWTRIAR